MKWAGVMVAVWVSCGLALAEVKTTVHQYDFEPAASAVTADGWTHMDPGVEATATSAGFITAETSVYAAADRDTSTQEPKKVTQDVVTFRGQGTDKPACAFQEIIPANASKVKITIYRCDPGDAFTTAGVSTRISVNGEKEKVIDSGQGGSGNYFPAIEYTMDLKVSAEPGTLVVRLYDTVDQSNARVNGIKFEYSPGP